MNFIADETFRLALDKALKAQGITKKKERNERIGDCLLIPVDRRDAILDEYESKAAAYQQNKRESKICPSEHDEQTNLIHWFRHTYPGVLIYAIPNGGFRNQTESLSLVMEGVVAGVADLFIDDWNCYVEMKSIKGSIWSDEQKAFKKKVESNGKTYLLAYGFEDAKRLIGKFLNNCNLLDK